VEILKIVVTGHVNSGKTQLIRTISEIDVVSTEARTTDAIREIKETTTVAMDFGRLTVDDDLVLYLYGTPGQERFNFMWDILSEGMLGFIVMVDATEPKTFIHAEQIINYFQSIDRCPYVVVANKQDKQDAWDTQAIEFILHLNNGVPVIPCNALQKESVKEVFIHFLEYILALENQ